MPLQPGHRLGQYTIVAAIGEGGMGEVYRARDTRLNRDVAIKVLPELFAADQDRVMRFEREAQVLASLNHPHIAQVYGVVEEPAALVMELVDGEDLAQRIARGAIPVREALEIAAQIAAALEAAHAQGIVHRDLKPANVKVRDDGAVKVLDFGLAKATDAAAPGGTPSPMNSPTITSPAAMTRMGVILGTAAYMAPEQAKGKPVDRGADLWAFAVVLYEMLTARRAFDGETITDVLAAIVTRDPDWTALPGDTPPPIRRLLRRCLDRDRRRRLSDAGEARYQIEEALAGTADEASPVAPAAARRSWLPWSLVAALAVVAAVALAWPQARDSAEPITLRYSIEPPAQAPLWLLARGALAVSPDGGTFVMVGSARGTTRLYARGRNSFETRTIDGTDGASHPAISPDGRWIVFFANGKLEKVPLEGGPATVLADSTDPRGLSWDEQGTIVFAGDSIGGLSKVSSDGGAVTTLTTTDVAKGERTHRWPQLLPGGRAVLFTVGSNASPDNYDNATVEAVTLPGNERKLLLSGASMARYVPSGHLVFARGRSLFAVPFDVATLTVTGTASTVLPGVAGDVTTGVAHFSVSREGTLAYVPAAADAAGGVTVAIDRHGRRETLAIPPGDHSDPYVSPDGTRLAITVTAGGGRDIWIHDFDRKTFTKLTFGGQNVTPIWSRDGRWIYYNTAAGQGLSSTIYRRAADGSSEAEAVVTLPFQGYLNSLTPDGRGIIIDNPPMAGKSSDVWRINLAAGAVAEPLIATSAGEYHPRLSPDGRWLAYVSQESGRSEIFVRAYDRAGGRWQVSTTGGEEPKWSADGRRLYYRASAAIMAVAVTSASAAFAFDTPTELFPGVYNPRSDSGLIFDVDSSRDRFIVIQPAQQDLTPTMVRVVDRWFLELPR